MKTQRLTIGSNGSERTTLVPRTGIILSKLVDASYKNFDILVKIIYSKNYNKIGDGGNIDGSAYSHPEASTDEAVIPASPSAESGPARS
jgi:hypothetical protein